ncbi:MAG: homocysteine S-methyltransferase family protein [Polyangiaceae bacterium]|nr:homocysteine S-methyltransferase family protein [Polyangiaceae bacterium]
MQRLLPGPVVTDGAWGTELQLAGLGAGDCTDAWNVQHPDRVEVVARAYVDAGSHVILTNTFGANRLQLARHGLAREVAAINRAGVAISRRAAGTSAAVFASLGPTGRLLGMGQTTESELREVYSEQARALAEAGADALVLETFADLDELRPAIAAAKEMEMTVVASMVFDSGARHDRTMMGTTPERAAEAMAEAGADVIGANCGRGSSGYVAVCQRMRQTVEHPLWIKPNAGLPELIDGKTIYRTSAADFVHDVLDIVAAGASFVGGCCGTNPGYLGAVAMALRDRRANR